jgi:hypothetical protein
VTVSVPNEHPAQAAGRGFDDVPGVESVEDRVPEASVSSCGDWDGGGGAVLEAVGATGVSGGSVDEGVRAPGESEDV